MSPDPGPPTTAEGVEDFDYWHNMKLAYNYDLVDPYEGSAYEEAFLYLAGRIPWEADPTPENEAEPEAEAGQ